MTFDDESERQRERSAALEAWVAAFDRDMVQSDDFAATVAAMAAHGCFDLRGVVERWILANPTVDATVTRPQLLPQDPAPSQLAFQQAAVVEQLPVAEEIGVLEPALLHEQALAVEEASAPAEHAADAEEITQSPVEGLAPDIAHFHSLLQGGIDREQIYEAFPASRLVIDEAVVQYEASAPILSEDPANPSRENLDDEMRRVRQELVESGKRPRRRWRSRA